MNGKQKARSLIEIEDKLRNILVAMFFVYLIVRSLYYFKTGETYDTFELVILGIFLVFGAIIYSVWLHFVLSKKNPEIYNEYLNIKKTEKKKEVRDTINSLKILSIVTIALTLIFSYTIFKHGFDFVLFLLSFGSLSIFILSVINLMIARSRGAI